MRALYSRFKKQDSSRAHFRSIVQQRAKSRSVNMDGANFLQMVLDYLNKNEAEIRTGAKTLSLQVRHLTFICRRFQKSNIGPFAHRTAAAAAAAATSTLANKPVDEAELMLLVNLMVAFSNVSSLRVEVKGIETADEGEQRESLLNIPSTVCPMDLFPSVTKLHLRGCPMRYFDTLHLFARNAVEMYVEYLPMSCLADLFVGTDASEEKYYSLDFGDGVEEEDLEEVDDPRHAGNISFGAAGDTGGADSQLRWEKLRILFLRHCNLVEVGAGLKSFPGILHLDLQHNRLTVVNALFKSARRSCPLLQHLDLSFNFISALSDSIIDPMTTAHLGLGNSLGRSLGDHSFLAARAGGSGAKQQVIAMSGRHRKGLRKLRVLSLRSNRITTLAGIDDLALIALEQLDLSDNVLSELRELGCLAALGQLQNLHLHGNPIQFLENYRGLVLAVMIESRRAYSRFVEGFVSTSTMDDGSGAANSSGIDDAWTRLSVLDGQEITEEERSRAASSINFDASFSSLQLSTGSPLANHLAAPMLEASPAPTSLSSSMPSGGFVQASEPPPMKAPSTSKRRNATTKSSSRTRATQAAGVGTSRGSGTDRFGASVGSDAASSLDVRGVMGDPENNGHLRSNSNRTPEDEFEDEDGGIFMDDIAPVTTKVAGSSPSPDDGGRGSNRSIRSHHSSSYRSNRGDDDNSDDGDDLGKAEFEGATAGNHYATHHSRHRMSTSTTRSSKVGIGDERGRGSGTTTNAAALEGGDSGTATGATPSSLAKGEMWEKMKQLREAHGSDWLKFVDQLKADLPIEAGTSAPSTSASIGAQQPPPSRSDHGEEVIPSRSSRVATVGGSSRSIRSAGSSSNRSIRSSASGGGSSRSLNGGSNRSLNEDRGGSSRSLNGDLRGSSRSLNGDRRGGSSRSLKDGRQQAMAAAVVATWQRSSNAVGKSGSNSDGDDLERQLAAAKATLKKLADSTFSIAVTVAEVYSRKLIVSYTSSGTLLLVEVDSKSGQAKKKTRLHELDRVKLLQLDAETAQLEVWFSAKHSRSYEISDSAVDCERAKTLHEAIDSFLDLNRAVGAQERSTGSAHGATSGTHKARTSGESDMSRRSEDASPATSPTGSSSSSVNSSAAGSPANRLPGNIAAYSSRSLEVEVFGPDLVTEVPVSDRQVLDRPGVCAEELLKQFGVVTTVGDLLPALQQRKLLASKEHLAAASRLAGASDSIGLQQCYAVHLTPEDSERLKMPFDSIGVEASLDQLWRWGIRSLRVDKVDAADDPSAVGAAAADAAATFTPGQPTNPEHFVSPPPRTGGARRVLAFGQDASQQDLGEPDDDDSSDDRADEIDPEAAAAAAAVADEALGIEADVTQGHWLDEDLKSGSGSPRGEAGASAVAHPDWQYFVKLSYGTTDGQDLARSGSVIDDASEGSSFSGTGTHDTGSLIGSVSRGHPIPRTVSAGGSSGRSVSPVGSYSMSGMGSLPVSENLEAFFRNEVISSTKGDDIDVIESLGLLPYRMERATEYMERPVVVLIKSKTFFMLEDQSRDQTFRDRPFFPLIVQRGLDSLYRVAIGFKSQRIRLDFEDTWDEEDDPSGCNNSYVLMSRDAARTWRFLGKLRELASFSVENEDLFALEAIKKSVFRPSEPLSAKVKLYIPCHVNTQNSFNSEGGLVPRSLIVTSNYIYLCVENYGAAKPTFEHVMAYVNRLDKKVVLEGDDTAAGGPATDLSKSTTKEDLSIVLIIRSQTKRLFRKSTESRWLLVAPTAAAKAELQRELKQTP